MPFSLSRDLWLVLKAQNMASAAMRGFASDIRMVGDSVALANLQASRSALRNQLATQRLTGATNEELLVTQKRINQIDEEIGRMRMAKSAMEEQRVSAQRLGAAMNGAAGAMMAVGTAATAAGIFGTIGLKQLVDSAVDYEKASALTRTQVDKFAVSLKDIEDIGLRVARKIGVPFKEIQPALYDIFSSLEIGAKGAEELLATFSKAAVAGQTDIRSAARATIGILNAFQLPLESVNHLMDLQFQLVQEGIGTYEEWTQRIGLVTPSAVRFGQSVETMTAALAATTRMGISAARSGTAVARAFDALSHPRAVAAMARIGVSAQDAEGKFRPLVEVLGEFREALTKVPEADKIAALLEVFKGAGGTIEARRFLQNMLLTPGNLELFTNILHEMENESGSFEEAYAIMADTIAIKSELMMNSWETLKIKMGQQLEPAFEKIILFLTRIFNWFNDLPPEQQKTIVQVIAFGVALATVGGLLLLVVGGLTAFFAAVALAGTGLFVILGVLGAVGLAIAAFAATLFVAWQKSETFRNIIKDTTAAVREFWQDYIVPAAQAIKQAFEENILPPLRILHAVLERRVMPILREMSEHFRGEFLKALGEVVNYIKENAISIFEKIGQVIREIVIPMIQRLTEYYHEHKEAIDNIIEVLVWFLKWIMLIAVFMATNFAVVIIGVIAVFALLGMAVANVIAVIVQLVEWFQSAKEWVENTAAAIKAFFNDHTLWSAGRDLISGLINGMFSKLGDLYHAITSIGGSAVDWFRNAISAFSPSKKFMEIGKDTIDGYMLGIKKTLPALQAQITASTAGLTGAAAGNGNRGEGSGVNQNFYITTQEIDPRRHAAELGWLIYGSS